MRRNWVVGFSLFTALAALGPSLSNGAEPVFTNKPRFRIPFRFDAQEMQRLRPREIQLYVSQDRGLSWQHRQSAPPNAGRFDFEAIQDDEYWFAVKTLDLQNQLFPRENAEPGLKVVVDTARPALELSLRELTRGKVQLSWNADDVHLDPTTLRLEYMQNGAAGWQQVSVVPQASGQTTWSVPQGGFVAVRGAIADLAGNIGQAEAQVNVGTNGGTNPDSEEIEYREPVAGGQTPNGPFAPLPGFGSTAPGTAGSTTPAMTQPIGSNPGTPANAARLPEMTGNVTAPPPFGKLISNSPANRNSTNEMHPPGSPAGAIDPRASSVLRQVVNTRSFHIGYRIDGAEPAGISAVELYITQDDGQRWFLYGEDADRQSPFVVTVPADGEYGFEFRVRNGNGPSAEPPQAGDRPSIVVMVDQTPPVAQLLPIQVSQGVSPSQLLIQWDVRDDHLGSAPVSLSCAASPVGPWYPIGGWQPNSGKFLWSPEPGMPERVYLRLTARDEAGNVTEVASPEAVSVNLPKSSTRMLGIGAPSPVSRPY